MANIPSDRKPLGLLFYQRIPQQDREVAKELYRHLIDPREYDEDGFDPPGEEAKEQAARAAEARAAWRSDGFVEALLEALIEAIKERHANGAIILWAYPSANSPECAFR
jgi:hypothetical protein